MSSHKLTHCKGNRDLYKYYRSNIEKESIYDVKPIVFGKVLEEFNSKMMDCLMYEGGKLILPCQLGSIIIKKTENDLDHAPIDWKLSKGKGKFYRHIQDFIYRISWYRKRCFTKNARKYRFQAVRQIKQRLTKAIREGTLRLQY